MLAMSHTPSRKILGLPRNIFMLGMTSFFNDLSNEMILAAFPAFFTSVLKAGAASLGLVEGVADGAANLLRIYSGRLSDKIQRRRVFIFIGYGLSVIMRPFYMLTTSVTAVLGLRVTDRIGKGLREAPRDVIISASADKGEIGRSFGYHRAMDTAGGILGPLAAYFILLHWPASMGVAGFNIIFAVAFGLGLIAVATIFFVQDVVGDKDDHGKRLLSLATFHVMPRGFKIYLAAIFMFSIGSLPIAVILLTTTSIGLSIADIPLFYMIYSIAYASFSYSAGRMSDKIGTAKVLVFGYVVLLAGYIAIGISESAVFLGMAFVILGLFSAATDATQRAWTGRLVAFEQRGTAYGLFQAAVGFGAMIAGIGGGWLWQTYSPAVALFAAAGAIIAGMITLAISLSITARQN